jgi:hypothetical protein
VSDEIDLLASVGGSPTSRYLVRGWASIYLDAISALTMLAERPRSGTAMD